MVLVRFQKALEKVSAFCDVPSLSDYLVPFKKNWCFLKYFVPLKI